MAGFSTTISRKDLEFMAKDIGPELVPFLKPEDLLKGMNAEKQQRLLSLFTPQQILANMSIKELITGISPEQQKKLFELVLKMLASGLAAKEEVNGKGSNN